MIPRRSSNAAVEINQLGAANTAIKGKAILAGKWV
jgi:hypothetical protein